MKFMRKKKFMSFFIVALFVGLIYGCSINTQTPTDRFAYGSYQTLTGLMGTYKTINNVVTNLRAQKMVSDEGWASYEKLANKFIDEYIYASQTMAGYKKGEITLDAAEVAVQIVDKALQELISYYQDKVPEDQRKPLF